MKIILISDLHTYKLTNDDYTSIGIEKPDVILTMGDINEEEIKKLHYIFANVSMFSVRGNHDLYNLPSEIDIHLRKVIKDEISFVGLTGIPERKTSYKEYHVIYPDEESFELVKDELASDILIAHAPAYQVNDYKAQRNMGFKGILEYLNTYKPKYFFYGHMHRPMEYWYKDTYCICTHGVNVFDTETNTLRQIITIR